MAANASVQVDAADAFGILITNGEFTSFVDPHFGQQVIIHTLKRGVMISIVRYVIMTLFFLFLQYSDSTQVLVTSSNAGSVSFVNSAFWGPSNQIAKVISGNSSF